MHLLVAQMGNQNAVVVSQKTLSKLMACSLRTTQYAITDLVDERWLQVVKLNGPGTIAAYVVNDRVAWGQRRDQKWMSVFSAAVVADIEDQDAIALAHESLKQIPVMYPGEFQLPTGPGEDPPSQPSIDGMEPDLPAIQQEAPKKHAKKTDADVRAALEAKGQQRITD